VNISPLKTPRRIIGAINCFYDVTERKRAEKALRESVTERKRAEEALRESETQLHLQTKNLNRWSKGVPPRSASLSKLMRCRNEEHRRIARNLHDSLGQYCVHKDEFDLLSRPDAPNRSEVLSEALENGCGGKPNLDSSMGDVRETTKYEFRLCPSMIPAPRTILSSLFGASGRLSKSKFIFMDAKY